MLFRMIEVGEPCPMCNAKIVGNSTLTPWTEAVQPRIIWICLILFIVMAEIYFIPFWKM